MNDNNTPTEGVEEVDPGAETEVPPDTDAFPVIAIVLLVVAMMGINGR